MSTPWRTIIRQVAKATNSFRSATTASAASTDYLASPLTATQVDGIILAFDLIADKALDVHGRLALTIASVADPVTGIGCHPWRSFFSTSSNSVLNGATIPTLTAGGKTIIGALGRPIRDSSSQYLQPASLERINRWLEGQAQGTYIGQPLLYNLNGGRVICTTGAVGISFECCGYERADQATALAANGNIGLPDALADGLVAGTIASMVTEDDLLPQAGFYREAYKAILDAIASGSTAMPGLKMIDAA